MYLQNQLPWLSCGSWPGSQSSVRPIQFGFFIQVHLGVIEPNNHKGFYPVLFLLSPQQFLSSGVKTFFSHLGKLPRNTLQFSHQSMCCLSIFGSSSFQFSYGFAMLFWSSENGFQLTADINFELLNFPHSERHSPPLCRYLSYRSYHRFLLSQQWSRTLQLQVAHPKKLWFLPPKVV